MLSHDEAVTSEAVKLVSKDYCGLLTAKQRMKKTLMAA